MSPAHPIGTAEAVVAGPRGDGRAGVTHAPYDPRPGPRARAPEEWDTHMDTETPLEQRVAAIEAREAIVALKHRYWRACDGKDPEGMRDCFLADGAEIDFGPMGRFDDVDALVDVYRRVALQRHEHGYRILDMHHGMHPEIEVAASATTASGRWTLRFRQIDRKTRTERVGAVEYEDEYQVEDGRWRIARSRARERWAIVRQLPDSAVIAEQIHG